MEEALLGIGIFLLLSLALIITQDILAPACIVCESFLVALLCAVLSSSFQSWNFELHYYTVLVICTALFCFIMGAAFGGKIRIKGNTQSVYREAKPLCFNNQFVNLLFVIQMVLIVIYIISFRKSGSIYSSLEWSTMMRMRRFATAYGEGLEDGLPSLVLHSTKIMKVNAYVSLYYLMHNLAVRQVRKKKIKVISWRLVFVIIAFFATSILQSARFDIMVTFLSAILIWYVFLMMYSNPSERINQYFKVLASMIGALFILAALMSALGTVVGRIASVTMFSEAYNYMGRSIQALDVFLNGENQLTVGEIRGAETFYGIYKLGGQLGILDMSHESFYLEFVYKDGISLGNTYSVLRKYYRDFGYIGIMLLPYIEGYILTRIYEHAKRAKSVHLNYWMILYSMLGPYMFLYSYEGFFFPNVLSINYLIIFIVAYIVTALATGKIRINDMKLKIAR